MEKSKTIERVVFIIAIVYVIGVLLYYGGLKEGFHIDELYSYGLSNSYYSPFPFANNQWLSGDYYQSYLTTSVDTRFEFGSVIYNQTRDVHPPFYYLVLHTISSFLPGVFSKWIGLSLNLLFYILTMVLVYKIVNYFLDNKSVSLIGMMFYGLSMGAISNFLFIRMYVFQTFLQVLLIYFSIKYIEEKPLNWKNIISLFFITTIGGLTQYYYYIFAFLVTVTIFLLFLAHKDYKKMIIYLVQSALSVLFAFLLFPSVFDHVTSTSRGTEVLENAEKGFSLRKLNNFTTHLSKDLFNNLLNWFLIVAIVFLIVAIFAELMKKNKIRIDEDLKLGQKKIISLLLVTVPTVLYFIIVSQVSHYQVSRYIYSIYPFVIILTTISIYLLSRFIFKSRNISLTILVAAVGLITLGSHVKNEPNYLFKGMEENHHSIENIEADDAIVLSDSAWRISSQINELRLFDNIYPGVISEDYNLPNDEHFESLDTAVIFIYEKLDSDELHEKIINTYKMDQKNYLYSVSTFNVYYYSN